ncbi:IS4 family transposase [Microcoleus sp. FACHB-53]|nr:IS4 family transposase [Microcoleus sp. FACHB-53]
MSWAAEELKTVNLGDKRRNRRLIKIVEDLSAMPIASVTQAARDGAAVQGIYEFWGNVRVGSNEILAAHRDSTLARVEGQELVLAVQDTTELDFSSQPCKQGLGALSKKDAHGLKVHSVLCVSPLGVPLGVLHQKVWAREKNRRTTGHQDRKRAIEQKESHRWLESLELTQQWIPQDKQVVTVADREADIYELFALPRREGSEFLIHACQPRGVKQTATDIDIKSLQEAIGQTAACGELTLELQRTPKRKARTATLTVRISSLELQPPLHHPQRNSLKPVKVQVVWAIEEMPPVGEKAIAWLLLTTLEVTSLEQAERCLRWYTYRWLIERYHYTLKSGCRLEQLQLERADRLERALATYAIVAWRLLWLTYEARCHPEESIEGILPAHYWQALYCHIYQTTVLPNDPPTLADCVRWIARLGGFLGRRQDGEPGVKTLWLGLQRLHDMASIWQLMVANAS